MEPNKFFNAPPTGWAEVLTPLFNELTRQSRQVARQEYELIVTEKAAAAEEADRRDDILTVAEVAKLLGISQQTVYEWVKQNKLQAFRLGRAVRFKRGQVLAALQAQTRTDGCRKYARRTNKKAC
ncbi:excisionase family DNA binding protein [Hymenobacter sp. UYAg731]